MLPLTRLWLWFSAWLVAAGWILSAFHQLNVGGYLVFFGIGALLLARARELWLPRRWPGKKYWRRFRRPAPLLFLALVVLSLASGSLYPAGNWDTNAYRLPRICHWLWTGQWHWIHTGDARMNIAGCNFEWLAAPLVLFSHTDRLLFLINWISYLSLPGLLFTVFRQLGVRRRAAWWWMWFLSAGWCFVFQASSAANDSFAVVYILAAVAFAFRARNRGSLGDLWLSLLAVALATGVKQTDIPLVLPWLAAAWPALPLLKTRKPATLAIAVLAALVSILPISLLNWKFAHSWLPTETAVGTFHLNPFWGVVGNAFCLPAQNLAPPFYEFLPPFYSRNIDVWNQAMNSFLHTSFGAHFSSFENFGFLSGDREHGVSEGNAGVGLGLALLLAASLGAALRQRKTAPPRRRPHPLVHLASWVAAVVFMAKVGSYENARQMAPYYPLLIASLIAARGQERLARRRLWQWAGIAVMFLTVLLVVVSTKRPLFPYRAWFADLQRAYPDNPTVRDESLRYLASMERAIEVRRDRFQRVFPADAKRIGYYSIDGPDEPGLWLPYGRRAAVRILPGDAPSAVREAGVRYVAVSTIALRQTHETIEEWLARYRGKIGVAFTSLGQFVSDPAARFDGYYIVVLD